MSSARDPFRLLPALAIAAMAWLALFPIASVDSYYHLAVGKRILDERAIPARGVGSATLGESPWHDNEWGFQVIVAAMAPVERDPSGVLVLTAAGRVALVGFRAACLAATLVFLSASMARRGVAPLTRSLALILCAFLTFGNLFWDVRPQILSYVALAALLYLLERDRTGATWAGPAMLAVVAAWANVHGAFVVGIAMVGAEAAGETLEALREPEARPRAVRLWAITAGAPFAACLNPLGWRQVVHPFVYLLRPEIHELNAEWMRPDFAHLPLLLLTVALFAVAVVAWRGVRLPDLLRPACLLLLLLSAIRHLPLAAIVLAPALAVAATYAARSGRRRRHFDPSDPAWGPPFARAGVAAALVAMIVGLAGAKFVGLVPRFEERGARPMPEAAVRFVAREGIEGNGFNAYRFGGFLMFRLFPEERVFMDGRNDLYGTFRTAVSVPLLEARDGWRERWHEAARRWKLGWVLVDETDPLAVALRDEPGWIGGVVTDGRPGTDGIVLFLADTPANRDHLARFVPPGGRSAGPG